MKIVEIVEFIFINMKVKDYCLMSNRSDETVAATDYIDLCLKSPEDSGMDEFIVLDNNMVVKNAFNYLYSLMNPESTMEFLSGRSESRVPRLYLYF